MIVSHLLNRRLLELFDEFAGALYFRDTSALKVTSASCKKKTVPVKNQNHSAIKVWSHNFDIFIPFRDSKFTVAFVVDVYRLLFVETH